MKKLLNLGCGDHFHQNWVNVDFASSSPSVIRHNLLKPLPFNEGTFDAVYHSHVLEHFNRGNAMRFLAECHRVLKHEGVIRVSVPDLESLARAYLNALDRALEGQQGAEDDLEWMHIELYDQMVRDDVDGEFHDYFSRKNLKNRDFVISRMGSMAEKIFEYHDRIVETEKYERLPTFRKRISKIKKWICSPREILLKSVLGNEYDTLIKGRNQVRGHLHKWMYDQVTLSTLLRNTGFINSRVVSAVESDIPEFSSYHLDTDPDGHVYHADSLFMEGFKK